MRFLPPFLLACLAVSAFACVHEDRHATGPTLPTESRSAPPPPAPPQYLVGDPGGSRTSAIVVPLRGGAQGLIVDKRRVIVSRGEPRVAADVPAEPIAGAMKLPTRLGNGFLFWTASSLFRSDAFDGQLFPVATTPSPIETVSIGPSYALVHTQNGERWSIDLPKGDRIALTPLGVVDVASTEDGRALAYDDRRSVYTSLDGGAHWTDVSAQMKSPPTRVFLAEDDEVWLTDSNDNAMRLEHDGHLAWFDHPPPDPTTEFRPKDPRWHGTEPPLRAAMRQGVAIDDRTAIVLEAGDLVRVDTRTGELVSVLPGHLPPDAFCQGIQAGGDILFACIPRGGGGPAASGSFVVSHVLSGDPIIEQTFSAGAEFFASDDGGLAYASACQAFSATPSPVPTVCVRTPSGQWEERDISMLTTDGGVAPGEVVRWIPRADGRVVALMSEPTAGLYDPATGSLQEISDDLKEVIGRGNAGYGRTAGRMRYMMKAPSSMGGFVDNSWSFVGPSLRGTGVRGETFEITEDGKLKASAYELEAAFSGSMGLGKSKDGRIYQTADRGVTWTEVAAPPSGEGVLDVIACSSVGCDLGAFYRVGWQLRPAQAMGAPTPSPAAPSVRRVRGVELACHPTGAVVSKVMARTDQSPEDLGLGNARLPVANEKADWAYIRNPAPRGIVASWGVGSVMNDTGDPEMAPSLRALFSGFSTQPNDASVLTVNGPNKSALALRRGVSYVAPFDPTGHVVRSGIAISDVVAAGRRAGMTQDEILEGDPTEDLAPFPIASADPTAATDLGLFDPTHSLLAVLHGERVRLAYRSQANNPNGSSGAPATISGVALAGDETAFLEVDSGNVEHVYKIGPNGTSDLFDVEPVNDAYHPANPDAVAAGPKGEIALLRTPSGSDPPSTLDPAYLVTPGMPSAALAPWSTLKLADDPACKSEPGGYRAALQVIGPWIRVSTPDLRVQDVPMIARVRWSDKRVCLEGFEVKLPTMNLRAPGSSAPSVVALGTWLVAKGSSFARVGVGEGVEWRQPLECSIVSTGP